ncbi:hypothetical protein GGX14DRAFT_438051 [Mycena pura]|uniref:Phosphatidate phosphatase APP1 catalytic domain-containing protein n=1 Tax=Mycena pura TaxID=153505 RepID=A0AAD6VNP1_9AGAR|nr:hypothetical protein GGX14DRAFT_438051 [Mycena pura]
MSKDMSWRAALSNSSSRLSTVKTYISQRDFKNLPHTLQRGVSADGTKQSWKEWAGQKISAGMRGVGGSQNSERITLFPGWAARRYRIDEVGRSLEAFDIELFVSGFASSHRAPELASRSQRAFLRLAKGFAALPKLDGSAQDSQLTLSTEDLLASVKLPPRPTEITEDLEVEALERQFQRINASDSQSSIDDSEPPNENLESPILASSSLPSGIQRLHRNLETRIQPFWSSVLSSRVVRLHLFGESLKEADGNPTRHNAAEQKDDAEHWVASRDVITAVDGSFQARIHVTWEEMCYHPGTLHIAFGDHNTEHELLVTATLQPASSVAPAVSDAPVEAKTMHMTLTNCPVRVISDIDDTVKLSNILSGARVVFRNVFVKEYKDIVIPGMGEWYTRMWQKGVRFHYVSNGPFELLPVLGDFFQVSQLPPGSIKLRSYAGRSLFSGLLSAPAARKRAGLLDILEAFRETRFFLIGDSGEQDLELYTELAWERPKQVLAIFIRDVEPGEMIDDPTGWRAAVVGTPNLNRDSGPRSARSPPLYSMPSPGLQAPREYFSTPPLSDEPRPLGEITPRPMTPSSNHFSLASSSTSRSSSTASSSSTQRMLEPERRRYDLQLRVWRARTQLPGHIALRLFRDPAECVEAEQILDKEK